MVEHEKIRVVQCGGCRLNFRAPVVTNDSKFLLCASGVCVKVYSTATEEFVHELRGHSDLVTGVLIKPSNHLQAYSCSVDGSVRLWDFTDGILIKSYFIGQPIYAMYASAQHKGMVFIVIQNQTNEVFQLVAVELSQDADERVKDEDRSLVLPHVNGSPECIAFGREDEYIASVEALCLTVYFFRKGKTSSFPLGLSNKKTVGKNTFTCVACHPKDDVIATGHVDGKIRLWRNFHQKKQYTQMTLHWHHDTVSSLCYTPEGTNLLSGGVESVLVQWKHGQETQKEFLPRLGASITHVTVSPDGALFCTSHSDNKITIIKSCKVSAVIQGLVKGQSIATDLLVDPRSKALVLNGKPGHLQFYSLQRDKLLFNLDIVQQEYIHELAVLQFRVVKAAFDASGEWLATVEELRPKTADLELHLKLWAFDHKTQSFALTTTISAPHEGEITAMCFGLADHRGGPPLITTSKDGHFKVWRQVPSPNHTEDEAGTSWACDFAGSYHNLRPHCCCFSADGSLLAVGFREVVTLWSPATWELLTTLSQPPGEIRNLCFGRLSCSKYLLGTTAKNLLCCWNLLTCSLEWSTSMDVSLLLPDPLSENMAAFCSQDNCTDLFVFKPCEPRPLFCQKAVCPGRVTRAVFTPRDAMQDSCDESCQWLNRSRLYFLSQCTELMTFITEDEEKQLLASHKEFTIDDTVAKTPFRLLLGQRPQGGGHLDPPDHSDTAKREPPPRGSAAVRELLQTPSHVLPAATFLCSMFVQSLLISVAGSSDPKHVEKEMESEKEEEDDSEEEEMETGHVGAKRPSTGASEAAEDAAPAMTRAQLRELRRVKKLDRSWLSGLLDS
ncbi:WD repeat-containing protein 75 [Syngnathus typhle]|uniref:WD repeat-containing protein 75 n=1 Tax=Syngnathus typhle TaxID=161592 RepID=UPI002A6A9D45|nr:WD repeat-containing protein 75 [Syngnathus typhle]